MRPKKNENEFVFWTIQLKGVADEIIEKNIKAFEDKHPEIKVVWIDIPIAETQKRILASTLSSTPPDLVNLNPEFSYLLARHGAVEYFKEEDTKNFNQNLQNILRFEGRAFAVPFYATSPVTLYNGEIYNKCDIKNPPKTYDELLLISEKLKKCANTETLSINLNEGEVFPKILNKYGIYDPKSLKEKGKKPYEVFKTLYSKGFISKECLTMNHREVIEKYMAENAATVVVGTNFIKSVQENALNVYSKSAVSEQLTGISGKYDVSLMNLLIPKKAKHKELAKEFALMLTDKESQLALARKTNVLPANKFALEDDYFKTAKNNDPLEIARTISAKQLNNLIEKEFSPLNKKEINDMINKSIESYLILNENTDSAIDKIKKELEEI
ncbi:extracellular solute-binding protein [bacterium]|nr:extracellular solute-binding protein [bacterium]